MAVIGAVLFVCLRRRSRARDPHMAIIPSGPRSATDPDPFIQATPTSQVPLTWSTEKGGYQHRLPLVHEFHSGSTSGSLTSPSTDVVTDATFSQTRPGGGDPDALHALERSMILVRRLDNLIHTLSNQGETESSPPEYDGNVAHHAAGAEQRV